MNRRKSLRTLFALTACMVLIPSAWAYVNGGDHHSTLHEYEHKLINQGWAVYVSDKPLTKDEDVNRMVGRVLRTLPEEKVDRIPLADKREVARIAREVLTGFSLFSRDREGQIGSLKYRIGEYSYTTWWETNYGGKRRIHARQTRQASFVALKIVETKPER